jgi:hypothetical protein
VVTRKYQPPRFRMDAVLTSPLDESLPLASIRTDSLWSLISSVAHDLVDLVRQRKHCAFPSPTSPSSPADLRGRPTSRRKFRQVPERSDGHRGI